MSEHYCHTPGASSVIRIAAHADAHGSGIVVRMTGRWSIPDQRYTLAQFARRVGISEGRVRVLYGETDAGRFPIADGHDADNRPWWLGQTIDQWCRHTGRPTPEAAAWPYSWPPAADPAPVVFRGEVVSEAAYRPTPAYVVVWDTPSGHVVHVSRYDDHHLDPHTAARIATQVLEPVFWSSAVVLVPYSVPFHQITDDVFDSWTANVDAFRLKVPEPEPVERPVRRRLRRRLAEFVAELVEEPGYVAHNEVRAESIGQPWTTGIAEALGRSIPFWIEGTCTPRAARLMTDAQAGADPFVVPDTTTEWPATLARLQAAVAASMPERFPIAWATLADEAMELRASLDVTHAALDGRHPGRFIVARPARPDWPLDLEYLVTTTVAKLGTQSTNELPSLDAIEAEVRELHSIEASMPWDSVEAAAISFAATRLTQEVRRARPELGGLAPVTYRFAVYGPVAEQYLVSCTPVGDQEALLLQPTRALARLLFQTDDHDTIRKGSYLEEARETVDTLYRDPAGRLVAKFRPRNGETYIAVEWPRGLPTGWNDSTIIAGDEPNGGLFAMTPGQDGNLRIEPVPNPGDDPAYTWGYTGTGPHTVYEALTRCALGSWDRTTSMIPGYEGSKSSPLMSRIIAADQDGPIRLPWPDVQRWAQHDFENHRG